MAGRPFALLGVNTDADREVIKSVMEKQQLNWRSWWDGGSPDGPIATQWQISNWPTIYVIDHKGIIRHIADDGGSVDIEPIETVIEELVKAAEAKTGKNNRSSE